MARKKDVIPTIGEWSEVKIDLLEEYARAYATIFAANRQGQFTTIYIDAFAGSGLGRRRGDGEIIIGSPLRVLQLKPAFTEYHFIDEDEQRLAKLNEEVSAAIASGEAQKRIFLYNGDAITILEKHLVGSVRYAEYKRALLFLDPYGLDIPWKLVCQVANQQTIDLLLNFSIMDLNRNNLPARRSELTEDQRSRAEGFLGQGWEDAIYPRSRQTNMFHVEHEKLSNDSIMLFYADRLHNQAGFTYVSTPLLFSGNGAQLYYLILASHKEAAKKIMDHLVRKYREKQ